MNVKRSSMLVSTRAQLSIEFVFVMGFSVILLLILLTIASVQLRTAFDDDARTIMDDATASIQRELSTATSVGDGYSRSFVLPATVRNQAYTLTNRLDGNSSIFTMVLGAHELSIRTPACQGNLTPGVNTIRTQNGTLWCNL